MSCNGSPLPAQGPSNPLQSGVCNWLIMSLEKLSVCAWVKTSSPHIQTQCHRDMPIASARWNASQFIPPQPRSRWVARSYLKALLYGPRLWCLRSVDVRGKEGCSDKEQRTPP